MSLKHINDQCTAASPEQLSQELTNPSGPPVKRDLLRDSLRDRIGGFLAVVCDNVDENDILLEAELILLAVAAGINDAATFSDYHLFTSNQTGNTVLLAVGSLGLGGGVVDILDVIFSLVFFVAGGCIFGQIGNRIGPRRRLWLLLTNFIQTTLTFTAAALRKWYAVDTQAASARSVISVLAFASGAQVAAARTINVPEITTAMVTSAYVDLLVDPDILQHHNRPRNRRLFFIICLLLGSFIGSISYKYVDPVLPFLLSSIAKSAVCLALFFNRPA